MASNPSVSYNPNQKFQVETREVAYRKDGDQSWMATIFQPQGAGPFPALLDVHGGAWNRGERSNDRVMNEALAADSGANGTAFGAASLLSWLLPATR